MTIFRLIKMFRWRLVKTKGRLVLMDFPCEEFCFVCLLVDIIIYSYLTLDDLNDP